LTGRKLYIFGLKELPLTREVPFTIDSLAFQAGAVISWGGDQPPTFSLNWTLTAGFDHTALKDRESVMGQARLAQAMAASSGTVQGGSGKQLMAPVRVRLVIPGHINCTGVIRRVTTTEGGPWDLMSAAVLPTTCDFNLEFIPINGYDPAMMVKTNVTTWMAGAINDRFYQS